MIEKLGAYNSVRTSIDGIHWESRPNLEDVINKINEIIDAVNTPIIEAEPTRHGHWIEEKSIGDCCYKCSECGFIRDAYLLEIENYCPQCGVKMDEVRE